LDLPSFISDVYTYFMLVYMKQTAVSVCTCRVTVVHKHLYLFCDVTVGTMTNVVYYAHIVYHDSSFTYIYTAIPAPCSFAFGITIPSPLFLD